MIQPRSAGQVQRALRLHGVAPGAAALMTLERAAADCAMRTGVYVTYRGKGDRLCARVGPGCKCFCGCSYERHAKGGCNKCACKAFRYIPQRPEEVGDWHLPRRPSFNVHKWRAKCRCKHAHDGHDPVTLRCRVSGCSCRRFASAFCCVVCDTLWEDHRTVTEDEASRRRAKRPVGRSFIPLAETPEAQPRRVPRAIARAAPLSRMFEEIESPPQ